MTLHQFLQESQGVQDFKNRSRGKTAESTPKEQLSPLGSQGSHFGFLLFCSLSAYPFLPLTMVNP